MKCCLIIGAFWLFGMLICISGFRSVAITSKKYDMRVFHNELDKVIKELKEIKKNVSTGNDGPNAV